jgi:hypothetical protein
MSAVRAGSSCGVFAGSVNAPVGSASSRNVPSSRNEERHAHRPVLGRQRHLPAVAFDGGDRAEGGARGIHGYLWSHLLDRDRGRRGGRRDRCGRSRPGRRERRCDADAGGGEEGGEADPARPRDEAPAGCPVMDHHLSLSTLN